MRNDNSVIWQPRPPWLVKTTSSMAGVRHAMEHSCDASGIAIRCLNGQDMTNLAGVFETFGRALDFPDYYGRNSAALDECLSDLSWLPAPGYVLLVAKSSSLLAHEPASEMTWLLTLLERICEEWSRPISLGEEWDRPAVPFHVVFQAESNKVTALSPQISSLPELTFNR